MHNKFPKPAIREERREVTLLFADLRGFTQVASSLETDPLFCELQSHVLDCLTDAVVAHDGFIVDYYGDGLMAMWNAPPNQPTHPELASRAGLQMLESLPAVAADWIRVIHSELRLGIGIHTGAVQLGNAGSTQRVKYGARGPNVVLASRVEAATKELRLPLIATQATIERLSEEFIAHRVCRAGMPGLQQPVDLYSVSSGEKSELLTHAWQTYDRALRHFEKNEYQNAINTLSDVNKSLIDIPTRFLLERARRELGRGLGRRFTDKPVASADGVIALAAK